MEAEYVTLIPVCTECKSLWLPNDKERWVAYLGCDETLAEPAEVFFYCPACAAREFGDA